MASVGDKAPKVHPADVAAAAKPQVARPNSAIQSPKKFPSPSKPSDVVRQGSKVADLSRQFSQADLPRQGSTGSNVSLPGSKSNNLSRQGSVFSPQKEALSCQGSVFSPQKEGHGGTQADPGVSLVDSPAPAISAAFAKASQLAKLPAISGQAQPTTLQGTPGQAGASHDAAAAEATEATPVDVPDTSAQPLASLPGAISPRVLAADEPQEPSATPALPAEGVATPAALANGSKIPLLQATEPADAQTTSTEFQPYPKQHPVMPLPLTEEHHPGEVMPASAGATQRTTGDAKVAVPPLMSASNDNIHSTLGAVQRDYIQMIGEQEEERQAHAAALADLHDGVDTVAAYDSQLKTGPSATETSQSALIPAAPAATRKGNNALFQMLAAGQTGTICNIHCSPCFQAESKFCYYDSQSCQRRCITLFLHRLTLSRMSSIVIIHTASE